MSDLSTTEFTQNNHTLVELLPHGGTPTCVYRKGLITDDR